MKEGIADDEPSFQEALKSGKREERLSVKMEEGIKLKHTILFTCITGIMGWPLIITAWCGGGG